jgi:hypothetical protein
LGAKEFPARADARDREALVIASRAGRFDIIRELLGEEEFHKWIMMKLSRDVEFCLRGVSALT